MRGGALIYFQLLQNAKQALRALGEVFLGKSFNGLASNVRLQYTKDVDNGFINFAIKGYFPLIYKSLSFIPSAGMKHWLGTPDRI